MKDILEGLRPGMVILIASVGLYLGSLSGHSQADAGHSPVRISDYSGPGSGHAFGFNVSYKVENHQMRDGVSYAVVISPNEPGVEIWTPIQAVTQLADGTEFYLVKGEKNFTNSIRIIPFKNK